MCSTTPVCFQPNSYNDKELFILFDHLIAIDKFLNVGSIEELEQNEIISLLNKGQMIESILNEKLSSKEYYNLNIKFKQYKKEKSIIDKPLTEFKNISDKIFLKILASNISQNLLLFTFKHFLQLFGKERLHSIVCDTAQIRVTYMKLMHLLNEEPNVESIFFVKSWYKCINYSDNGLDEVKTSVSAMCSSPNAIKILLNILSLKQSIDEVKLIQNLVLNEIVNKLDTDLEQNLWEVIFRSELFLRINETYPQFLELTLNKLKSICNRFSYNNESKLWESTCSSSTGYYDLIKIFRELYFSPHLIARLSEFIDFNQLNYDRLLWLDIEKHIINKL